MSYTSSEVALKSKVRAVDGTSCVGVSAWQSITLTSVLNTWCDGGVLTVPVPVAFRNKCERVTGPLPERIRSIFAGVNATRTSGTGPGPEQV